MPVVQLISPEQVDASLQETMARTEAHFGHIPDLVKAMASNPDMCSAITEFMIQALGPGRIDWGFKELIILKTLRSIGSYYGYGGHERLAAELGVPTTKIGDVANSLWRTSPHFSEAERAIFELVEQIAIDANDVGDPLWERLRSHWDNGQLLEATSVITTFIHIGRLGDSLGVSDPVLFTRPVSDD